MTLCQQICVIMGWNQFALVILMSIFFTGVSSLRCYQCSGQTNYDPDHCFKTDPEFTIITECQRGSECQKRVERIDRRNIVINRGCTANCAGRSYIYTDDFQVHCCKDDQCNTAPTAHSTVLFLPLLAALLLLHTYLLQFRCHGIDTQAKLN